MSRYVASKKSGWRSLGEIQTKRDGTKLVYVRGRTVSPSSCWDTEAPFRPIGRRVGDGPIDPAQRHDQTEAVADCWPWRRGLALPGTDGTCWEDRLAGGGEAGRKASAFAHSYRSRATQRVRHGRRGAGVPRGLLLAYDTEKRLQKEGLAKSFTLDEWVVEAGPDYFDDTVKGVQKGIEEAKTVAAKRLSAPYKSDK